MSQYIVKPERWKRIDDTLYEISSRGRVRHIQTKRIRKPQHNHRGYQIITLSNPPHGWRTIVVHIEVAKAFVDNPEGKPEVNHINGCKDDNYEENLEWTTRLENQRHAIAMGLSNVVGENNPAASLAESDVRAILAAYTGKRGEQQALASQYGVSRTTINYIVNGRTWKHVHKEVAR